MRSYLLQSRRATAVCMTAAMALAGAVAIPAVAFEIPHFGYGRCSKCNCRHFEGNSSTCANSGCGHAYYDHY